MIFVLDYLNRKYCVMFFFSFFCDDYFILLPSCVGEKNTKKVLVRNFRIICE